jgi:hypothetical protein
MHVGFHDEITKFDTRSSRALDIKQALLKPTQGRLIGFYE